MCLASSSSFVVVLRLAAIVVVVVASVVGEKLYSQHPRRTGSYLFQWDATATTPSSPAVTSNANKYRAIIFPDTPQNFRPGFPKLPPVPPSRYNKTSTTATALAMAHAALNVDADGKANYTSTAFVNELPLDFAMKLNGVENFGQFYSMFPEDVMDEGLQHTQAIPIERFAGATSLDVQRNAAFPRARPAHCMPELQPVEFPVISDPTIHYFPQCTRIERCGGCCQHELLTCKPVRTELVSFQVHKFQYSSDNNVVNRGTEIMQLEKHKECRCGCKLSAQDCSLLQHFVETECRCICENTEDREKCERDGKTRKNWDPIYCVCKCVEVRECSTGTTFDNDTCSCILTQRKRQGTLLELPGTSNRGGNTDRLSYDVDDVFRWNGQSTTIKYPSSRRNRRGWRRRKSVTK